MATELKERRRLATLENFRKHLNLFHADLMMAAFEDESISDDDYAKGYVAILFAERAELDEFVPEEYKHLVEDYEDFPNPDNVRCCSHCGIPIKEGYYLGGEYACTEKCAIALYDGDKKQFESDLEEDEKHNYGEVYFTEWESYFYE